MKTLQIKQKSFDADYAGVGYLGMVKAQIHDTRLLSEIAPDLEGADEVVLIEDDEQTGLFEGYTVLMRMERVDAEAVCFLLARPEDQGDGTV